MFKFLATVRPDERSVAWVAFATLLAVTASHALLETARDALFLASIAPTKLPWVYLLVAVLSGLAVPAQKSLPAALRALPLTLGLSSALVFTLWLALPALGSPGLYALYVLSSVVVTLILLEFWLSVGETFNARQAKRLYGFIGVGSVAGAVTGFAAAGLLAEVTAPRHLVLTAAGVLASASILAWRRPLGAGNHTEKDQPDIPIVQAFQRPYVRHVTALLVVSTLTLTVADYLFKAAIADAVQPSDLASTLAWLYLGLNIVSLGLQTLLVQRIVQRVGVVRALLPLPILLALGGVGVALGFGLAGAISLKGSDGALKHTLNKTATELLFVPMPSRVRASIKGFLDTVGHRGAQAAGSVAILTALALGASTVALAIPLVALAVLWLVIGSRLKRPYVDVFRHNLAEVARETHYPFVDLDVSSFASLMAAFSSQDDERVLAALDILEREDKTEAVPTLLLYHPSEDVICAVLDVFARSGRTDFLPLANRLEGQATPKVHAAIVRATMAVAPDIAELQRHLGSHCRATRASSAVYLQSLGVWSMEQGREQFDILIQHDNGRTALIAMAAAAPQAPSDLLDEYLVQARSSPDDEVRRGALEAMGRLARPALLPATILALAERPTRHVARSALYLHGLEGVRALSEAMVDPSTPNAIRWEIPRAIVGFRNTDITLELAESLGHTSGMLQYRIIRALETASNEIADETLAALLASRPVLMDSAHQTLAACFSMLDQQLSIERGASEDPKRITPEHGFLTQLLQDKRSHAVERVVRVIGLMRPNEDFGRILRGLNSDIPSIRASSLELLDYVCPAQLRGPLLAMLDGGDDRARLAGGQALHQARRTDYEAVLTQLINSRSESLQVLAVAQVGALRLTHFGEQVRQLPGLADSMIGDAVVRTLRRLHEVQHHA
jgi:AAA family ATP:ADP antiporter